MQPGGRAHHAKYAPATLFSPGIAVHRVRVYTLLLSRSEITAQASPARARKNTLVYYPAGARARRKPRIACNTNRSHLVDGNILTPTLRDSKRVPPYKLAGHPACFYLNSIHTFKKKRLLVYTYFFDFLNFYCRVLL